MPQNWEFSNVGADCTPEIVIKATNPITPGEKVLLFQAGTGCFGRPVVLSMTSVNGQASELVIGFGDNAIGDQSLEINKNYDNLSVIPFWSAEEFVIGDVRNIYSDDGNNLGDKLIIRLSKRQKLFFKIKDFDLIKDYSPKILVERYVGSKTRGTGGQKSGAAYRTAPRKNTIPITSSMAEIDFRQEECFRLDGLRIRAKSYKRTNVHSAYAYFQFRMQLTINGMTIISIPVVRLKLQASLQNDNSIKEANVDKIRTKATAKKASATLEVQQIKNEIEEVTSDAEREALQVKLSKVSLELQEAEALIEATEHPGQPDNRQVYTRYYAISYRIT